MPASSRSSSAVADGRELPRTLLVDNYDSYTFNLLQLLTQKAKQHYGIEDADNDFVRQKLMVIRNDQYPWHVVRDRILPHVDCIVISPGPGSPDRQADFGVCTELIRNAEQAKPVLGVCLGHQGIALAFGARIRRCATPVHGQLCPIEILSDDTGRPGLFDGIESGFRAVRYHSLTVSDDGFPHHELQVLARAAGSIHAFSEHCGRFQVPTNEIMALKHRDRPLYGVQFHPESICSEYGARIIDNFVAITHDYARRSDFVAHNSGYASRIPPEIAAMSLLALDDRTWHCDPSSPPPLSQSSLPGGCGRFALVAESVDLAIPGGMDAAELGDQLQALLYGNDAMPLWLDSAKSDTPGGAVSIMASGCGTATVRYQLSGRQVSVVAFGADDGGCGPESIYSARLPDRDALGNPVSFWTWMQDVYDQTLISPSDAQSLRFQCGWIGYFAYEMKNECVGMATNCEAFGSHAGVQQEPGQRMPDAQLTFVDRCVVLELGREPPRATVLALAAHGECRRAAPAHSWLASLGFGSRSLAATWVREQSCKIRAWLAGPRPAGTHVSAHPLGESSEQMLRLRPVLSRDEYLDAIGRAKQQILQGESYEICLTNQFRATLSDSQAIKTSTQMRRHYINMRRRNPAPYGALLWYSDIAAGIASCSPERFLSIEQCGPDDRRVEMKPIKGTTRRRPRPAIGPCSEHTHGDHSAVCAECLRQWEIDDSRRASELEMDVKERAENLMIVDLVRHDLNSVSNGNPESIPRGVYSGAIGYLSAHGAADFSVVIRTAVVDHCGTRVSVGAGGALTTLSDPKAEWAEVETKLYTIAPSLSPTLPV
ncbi:para-aminobenzoate synthase, (PABA) [Coemansia biformis]|uniref:aminodeoxychorismate synthase n=1 Tax=Coemansia biformis TaxID=1286918 RepID=A0A9W8CYT9_9FUNG|nr:para-aminobenzoate synthase, (PABA) [Coemansia biformis]